ncbi:MAG: InlB B-repeat-containing protein [Bacteroidales bacterium]|nr:InlB B-repeat-containing protein [Bacteroidales bacterium]
MKNFNLLRKSERKSVGTTLALTVGSPSFDRRGTMLKHYAFMLLFLLGSLNVWGEEMAVDFESATSDYSDWTFTNFTTQQTNTSVTAHGGNYFGTTGGKTTGSLQTKDKVNPSSITFYYSKTTNNTTASYWKVQVSTDGSKWTDVSQKSAAANVDKGQWYAYEENLSAYSDVYVRIYYDGTSAVRCLDDVVLTTSGGGKTLTSIAVSGTPTKTSYYAGDDFDPAGLTVTGTYSDATSGPISSGITWTYNPSQTLVKDQTSIGVIATVSEIASPQYNVTGLSVTAASLKITITQNEVTDFTNTYAEYSWTAAGVSGKMYAFKNSGMQFNSKKTGYYVYNTDPIPGRITKITMIQASGTAQNWTPYVSTTAMTSASGTALDAKSVTTSGASWDVTGSNRYFYLTVAGGSTVIGSIVIEYTEEAPPAVEAPSISGDENFVTSTTVTISHAEADHIYYTTNGDDPTTSSTEYSVPFEVNATTTIKAIAVKGEDVSAVAEMTFTKATILTVAQAKTAIDAGGDLSNKYVAGIVSKIDTYNSTYNSLTYWISDDGTTANQLQVYSGLAGVVKNQFASKDDIHVGDDVTVKGTLKKYSSTYEFDKNNVIVAYKPIALLSWSAASYDAELGGSNSFPTLTNTNSVSVTYSSSNTDAATINATTGEISLVAEGSTTIKATFAGNENYKANAVSYSLKVKNAITRADISFEENGGSEVADLTQQTNLPDPLPVITKAGKNFGGWFIDSKMETPAVAGAAVTSTAAITLYAKWLDPYTVAEALDIIDGYGDNETSEANVYVAGIISSVDSYNSTYKSITYYISVDGTTTGQLQVYSGKGLNGADFIGEDDLQKGDNVIVYGELKKYVKNTTVTPEVNQNSQLYYFNRPTVDLVSIALPATASVKVGKTTTLTPVFDPENATDKVVSWASENTSIATVDNGVVTGVSAGTVNITVTYVADPTINATCAVTVSEPLSFNDPNYEWQLVTSDAQLVAGKYYVIASASAGKTANKTITSGYLGTVASTIADGAIAYNALGENTAIFKLGGKSGAWTLVEAIEEKQLTGATTANLVWDGATNTTWPISIEGENAIIGASAGYRVLYNVNNPRFKPYDSKTSASMVLPQLYVWALKTYKLRYDANGGENAPAAQAADGEGKATVTDAKPTYTDHIFNGWNTLIGGDGEAKVAGDVIDLSAGDVTLYAQWRTPNTYSISYDANGGTLIEGESEITPTSVTEGNAYTIEENVYEVEGKLFIGWKANGVTYNAGQEIYPTEDMAFVAQWGDPNVTDFMLVTDVKQLKDGDKVYIVAADYNVAMGTQHSTDYRNYVEIAKQNNRVVILNATPVEFTVGKVDDNFTFNDGTGYLYASSSSSNNLNTEADLDDNGKWAISINANGVASIIAQGTNSRKDMRYNASSGQERFSCYRSGQKAVSIYKRPDYTRNVSGNYATICLPKAGQIIGATLYEIAYYGEASKKIFFDEIVNGEMEAGIPYIFQPAAGVEKINVYYSDNTAEDVVAGNRNGLIGFYDLNNPAARHDITQDAGYYILYNNQYWLVSGRAAYVENYRAFIRLADITPSEPTLAPGRRRISMSVNDTQTTTGFENGELINGENGVQKVLIDGELFILRGEKMYDAKGQLVK